MCCLDDRAVGDMSKQLNVEDARGSKAKTPKCRREQEQLRQPEGGGVRPVVTGRAFVSDEMPSPTPPCRAQPGVLRGHRPVARATGGKRPLVDAVHMCVSIAET